MFSKDLRRMLITHLCLRFYLETVVWICGMFHNNMKNEICFYKLFDDELLVMFLLLIILRILSTLCFNA